MVDILIVCLLTVMLHQSIRQTLVQKADLHHTPIDST